MTKGFVVLAQNNQDVDYVKQAYALALSIKYTQKTYNSVSIITNDEVCDEYRTVFDNVIDIPWDDNASNSVWKVENRWKIYHASPYDETIVLDTDMLLLEDVTSWWEYCSAFDLKFCSRIKNYKLETIVDSVFRKAFDENNLPNPYVALHYFKKSVLAYEFYKVLEFVCNNWEWCYTKFAPKYYQSWLSLDLAAAIAIDLMGLNEQVLDNQSPLEFIHMKTPLQGWNVDPVSWRETLSYNFNNNGELIVGNIKQTRLFHYVEKDFITDAMLTKLQRFNSGT